MRRAGVVAATVATAVGAVASVLTRDVRRAVEARTAMEERAAELEHDGLVGTAAGLPYRLAVLGDSTAAGFGLQDADLAWPRATARLLSERLGRRVDLRCHAVRGHRIATVTAVQVDRLAGWQPDLVLVSVGGNDALGRLAPWSVVRDQRELLERLEQVVPDATVVLVGCPHVDRAPGLGPVISTALAVPRMTTRWAQRHQASRAGVPLVFFDPLADDEFGPDGFHASAAAHARAARETVELLDGLL